MKNTIFIIATCLILYGCRAYLTSRYKLNRPFKFKAREEYLQYLESSLKIDKRTIIYPGSGSFNQFLYKVSQDTMGIYYGCLFNDSTEIIRSAELKENTSCIGRILKEITGNTVRTDSLAPLLVKSDFKEFAFQFAINDAQVNINQSEKKLKLILIYFYSMGTYYNKFFREVMHFYNENRDHLDLYIIAPEVSGTK